MDREGGAGLRGGKLARASGEQVFDGLGFHCQQCVEKYLKAALSEAGVPFPKTHHLGTLLDLIKQSVPEWEKWRASLNLLNRFGVNARYPGESADETGSEIRAALRSHLAPDEELG